MLSTDTQNTLPFTFQFKLVKLLSRVRLFATPWTVAHQVPLSMGFSRKEYWSGLPFPSPFLLIGNCLSKMLCYSEGLL